MSALSDVTPAESTNGAVAPMNDEASSNGVHLCPEPIESREPHGSLGSACFSQDERYLYQVTRSVPNGLKNVVTIILLSPATGTDDQQLDPTVRKCYEFVRKIGMSNMRIVYAFPIKGPDQLMLNRPDRDGPPGVNDSHITDAIADASIVIVGWGPRMSQPVPRLFYRYKQLKTLLSGINVYALQVTDKGQPWSPFLVPDTIDGKPKLLPYTWDAVDPDDKTPATDAA